MRVIFSTTPGPRLLNSAIEETPETKSPADQVDLPSTSKDTSHSSGSSGNGRAVLIRIVLGAAALLALLFIYGRNQATQSSAVATPGLIAVRIPGGGVVPITAAMIHVTAISLGHPQLALVNGQQVAEGDQVTLHLTTPNAVVKLQILKIADGQVDLGDGKQVLSVHVEVPAAKKPKRP